MFKAILKFIGASLRKDKGKSEQLLYLYGVKPIEAHRTVLDECTVTKS